MLEIEWYFTWLSQFVPQIGGKCEKLGLGRVGTPSFAAKPRRGKIGSEKDSCMCGIKLWDRKADKLNVLKQEAKLPAEDIYF